jgi:hypothetical protein
METGVHSERQKEYGDKSDDSPAMSQVAGECLPNSNSSLRESGRHGSEKKVRVLTIPAMSAAPSAAQSRDQPPRAPPYRRRTLLALSFLLFGLITGWASSYLSAYTDDAYLTSDVVSITPEVSGPVEAVFVPTING